MKEQSLSGDFSWASYVYYGDPRMCLSRRDGDGDGVPPEPEAEEATGDLATALAPAAAAAATDVQHQASSDLAREYENVRASMPFGFERTRKMSDIVTRARALARGGDCSTVIETCAAGGDGDRVIGLGLIQAQPDAAHLPHVLQSIAAPRSAFEQYHALVAAKALAPLLDAAGKETLQKALTEQTSDPSFYGTDRHLLASDILTRLRDESSVSGNPAFV